MKKPQPFGKYYLLEKINVGGMAEVFRAKAFGVEGFERLVAVKRILPNIAEDKEFIRMFIEEAKLSVQLNHANIAQIFDLGVVDGSYYIALEHVHGRDLRGIFDRCRQLGEAMPVAQACFMVMKVCEGLDYAHNKRDQSGRELSLVHRDVSPQNVLISFEGEVKIIDFGIAKAAGKGSKTQAGILKGKFGYMSPEQVRGLPVDRRSDVFSCGIVLYELLTGERLFVGESDFSTLEKVRNVEILPPSTYNRKIPDELERIVLKALAKDVEDRYQNAIDLHDELQAFVYTAGEFYSRKDLAGWMKKTFGKEIEEETAKLESYRQLKAPAQEPAPSTRTPPSGSSLRSPAPLHTPPPVRRSTQGIGVVGPASSPSGTRPPPPPPTRMSGQHAAVSLPTSAPPQVTKPRREESGDLAWDDDELETQIYDNPEDDPKNKRPGGRPLPTSPSLAAQSAPHATATANDPMAAAPPAPTSQGPDLSSLVSSTSKGWEAGPVPYPESRQVQSGSPATTMNGIGNLGGNGLPPKFPMGPTNTNTGPNKIHGPDPVPPMLQGYPVVRPNDAPALFDTGPRDTSASHPMVREIDPFDPMMSSMSSFGAGVVRQRSSKRGILMIAVGGAAVAAAAVVAVIALSSSDDKQAIAAGQGPGNDTTAPAPSVVAPVDPNTGFDLYVTPAGMTNWKLDGESRQDRLPSKIRSIAPGPHTIQIEPPPGFMSESRQVVVEAGQAGRVEIDLQPIQGITGSFDSTPPGATVSLIIDGKRELLGPSPAKAPLDPRNTYQVLFEKPGYVSVNKPITFSGALEEKIIVNLEKAGSVSATAEARAVKTGGDGKPDAVAAQSGQPRTGGPKTAKTVKTTGEVKVPVLGGGEVKTGGGEPKTGGGEPKVPAFGSPDPKPERPPVEVVKGTGTLMLGSKPSCEIYVDGKNTGLHTPQRELKLPAGRRRITLVNNEFGIKESFVVDIKPDDTTKMIKDYSERLPK